MNECKVCTHRNVSQIENTVATGKRSVLSISRQFNVSYDSLRRHIANDHRALGKSGVAPLAEPARGSGGVRPKPAPSKPMPDAVWEFSADEMATSAAADDDFNTIVAKVAGVPVEDVSACVEGHVGDVNGCASCVVIGTNAADALWLALADFHESITPNFQSGRWVAP